MREKVIKWNSMVLTAPSLSSPMARQPGCSWNKRSKGKKCWPLSREKTGGAHGRPLSLPATRMIPGICSCRTALRGYAKRTLPLNLKPWEGMQNPKASGYGETKIQFPRGLTEDNKLCSLRSSAKPKVSGNDFEEQKLHLFERTEIVISDKKEGLMAIGKIRAKGHSFHVVDENSEV